jgi:hypothetical protein
MPPKLLMLVEKTTNYLLEPMISQLRIISLWMLICFIQVGLFLSTFENFSAYKLLNFDTLLQVTVFFLFFTELALIMANIFALTIWVSAKFLKGEGSYSQTCIAFLWAMIYLTIPFGCSFLLLKFDLAIPIILKTILRLGMLASLIFGFVILLKKISTLHKLSFMRSFFTLILSAIILLPLGLFAIYINKMSGDFNSSLRTLFMLFVPISIQAIALFTFVIISTKTIERFKKRS